jgi:hypothetical protein
VDRVAGYGARLNFILLLLVGVFAFVDVWRDFVVVSAGSRRLQLGILDVIIKDRPTRGG